MMSPVTRQLDSDIQSARPRTEQTLETPSSPDVTPLPLSCSPAARALSGEVCSFSEIHGDGGTVTPILQGRLEVPEVTQG